ILVLVIPLEKRKWTRGVMSLASGLGYLVGPISAGALTEQVRGLWSCLSFQAFIALFVLVSLHGRLQTPQQLPNSLKGKIKNLGPFSTVLLVLFTNLSVAGLELGRWIDPRFYTLLVAAGLVVMLFILILLRSGPDPAIPTDTMSDRSMSFAFIFSTCMGGGAISMLYWISFWVQGSGARSLKTGLGTLPLVIGMSVSSIPIGLLQHQIEHHPPWMMAAAIFMSVGAGLSTTIDATTEIWSDKWFSCLLVFGLGIGCGIHMPGIVAHTAQDPADIANGIGLLQGTFSLGSGVVFAVGHAIFASFVRRGILEENIMSYMWERTRPNTAGPAEGDDRVFYEALTKSLYVVVALSCFAIIPALGAEWKRVGGKREQLMLSFIRGARR
ncbi:hypothetical protein B0T14DRAFT_429776, partial [Immersiella caudata]